MADLSLVTDNYLPTASETFSDNLSGSIVAGATTVPVNSAAEYADGQTVVLTVEPGTVNEATFVGKKDTGVNQFIECIWTEGNTAVGHDAGATIIDYDSATHYNLLSKALQLIMNQDGTLKDTPIRTALGLTASATNGWEVFPYTFSVSSGYNVGDHLYDLTVANQDVRSFISEGMYLKMNRSTTAPTQCMDLEASSSQYAQRASGSVTGTLSTITDDITIEAWVNIESYQTNAYLFSKVGTAGTNGVRFYLDGYGRVYIDGFLSSGNLKLWRTRVQPQLGVWTHLAASMDMSGGVGAIYINGVSVTTDTGHAGTANSFTNAGNVFVGTQVGAATFFDGKVSDVRVWNAVRTATQIRDNMNQQLVGTETNLIAYWKLSGDLNDSTASANHLTGSGGAVATTSDNPFQNTQFVKVASVSYSAPNSTVRVLALENHCIPNMTLNTQYYSSSASPYNLPVEQNILRVKTAMNAEIVIPTNTSQDFASIGAVVMMTVPRACVAKVTVAMGIGSTTDFEFRPEIRLNGSVVRTFTPNAALGSAGGRAPSRTFTATIQLTAGTNYISAGTSNVSGTSMSLAAAGAYITAEVPGSVAVR